MAVDCQNWEPLARRLDVAARIAVDRQRWVGEATIEDDAARTADAVIRVVVSRCELACCA
jgi:hypothetical protein